MVDLLGNAMIKICQVAVKQAQKQKLKRLKRPKQLLPKEMKVKEETKANQPYQMKI